MGLKVVLRGLGQARDQVVEIFHLDTGDTVTPWMRVADFVQGAWMVWRCPAGTGGCVRSQKRERGLGLLT